jgi:hypothetical protein
MDELLIELKQLIEKNDEKSNSKIIELIREKNVYELIYVNGENLLHWASVSNNCEIAEYLLTVKKIHVNLENYRFTTPLYYATMKGNLEVIKVLMGHNANTAIRSGFSGMFPEDIVETKELLDLVKIDHEIKENKFLHYGYRLYMFWLSNLNYFHNRNKNMVSGVVIIPEAKQLYEQGIEKLANECQKIYEHYLQYVVLFKNNLLNSKVCLSCLKENNIKKCSRCKSVYFCNVECQKNAHILHKFDCVKN